MSSDLSIENAEVSQIEATSIALIEDQGNVATNTGDNVIATIDPKAPEEDDQDARLLF